MRLQSCICDKRDLKRPEALPVKTLKSRFWPITMTAWRKLLQCNLYYVTRDTLWLRWHKKWHTAPRGPDIDPIARGRCAQRSTCWVYKNQIWWFNIKLWCLAPNAWTNSNLRLIIRIEMLLDVRINFETNFYGKCTIKVLIELYSWLINRKKSVKWPKLENVQAEPYLYSVWVKYLISI